MASPAQLSALLLVVLLHVAAPQTSDDLVVRVTQGALRGHRVQREPGATLRSFYAFEGVPYARPPVGERRFKDPEEPELWSGVRNATALGANCVQNVIATRAVIGEENCLFLNVYTSDPPAKWATVKRPVIVWIHGGAFVQGSGDTVFARPDPILRQEVLFVSLNYRLGVLGFLNTEDTQAPGNAALKDQNLALRWVKKNIAAFGGDPKQITLMGESAGGVAVHFHMMSPLSRGLFQRAIAVSGTAMIGVPQPRRSALALRRRWDSACPGEAPDAVAACLRRVDASELVRNQYDVPLEPFQDFFGGNTFRPSIESPASGKARFITADPQQLLKEGRFSKIPFITGFTSGEGILVLVFTSLLVDPARWEVLDRNFEEIFRWIMPQGLQTREAAREVRKFYFGDRSLLNGNDDMELLERFQLLFLDISMALGAATSGKLMSEKGSHVYLYQFSRDGPLDYLKRSMNASYFPGVGHGDDMAYVFDFTDLNTGELLPVPPSEQSIRERQLKIFTNFVKTGNPTPPDSGLLHWPLYSPGRERYMNMDVELSVREPVMGERLAFWRRLGAQDNTKTTDSATGTTKTNTGTSMSPASRGR